MESSSGYLDITNKEEQKIFIKEKIITDDFNYRSPNDIVSKIDEKSNSSAEMPVRTERSESNPDFISSAEDSESECVSEEEVVKQSTTEILAAHPEIAAFSGWRGPYAQFEASSSEEDTPSSVDCNGLENNVSESAAGGNAKTTVGRFLCRFCKARLHSKQDFLAHARAEHAGDKPHKCELCPKTFTLKQNLIKHLRRHTGQKTHECDVCHAFFWEAQHLHNHKMTHSGERPHACPHCGKRFGFKHHLDRHVKIHLGEKPFQCTECCKCFSAEWLLVNHMKAHTGFTPFECSVCLKRFMKKHYLTSHMKTHTGEGQYECSACCKLFMTPHSLETHMKVHSVENPSVCPTCRKCFVKKTQLHSHMKKGVCDKPFQCSICGSRFTRRYNLRFHAKKHNNPECA